MPRTFDPRAYLGYTGNPLPVAEESVPLPDQVRKRFENAGQGAFVPYISPWETLAGANNYRRAGHDLDIADAEDRFINEVGSGKTGFREFLDANPMASFSPMVQTYEKLNARTQRHDPFETSLAREGSVPLQKYRTAVQGGIDPTAAFSTVRDDINKEKEAKQKHADNELFFVKEGGDLEDFQALHDAGATPGQMLDFIKKKGKAPSDTEVSKHGKLRTALDQASRAIETSGKANDDLKKAAFAAAFGRELDEKSADDWAKAYQALRKQTLEPAQNAYDEFVSGLQERGVRIPGTKTLRGGAPVAPMLPVVPVAPAAPVAPTAAVFETKLPPEHETKFQQWKAQNAPNDSGEDYDLRGAYLQNATGKNDPRGHGPDTFKKPNHPTFSDQSQYSTPEQPGGHWDTDAQGNSTFQPSPWMAADANRMASLREYMKRVEPNTRLILPVTSTSTSPWDGGTAAVKPGLSPLSQVRKALKP